MPMPLAVCISAFDNSMFILYLCSFAYSFDLIENLSVYFKCSCSIVYDALFVLIYWFRGAVRLIHKYLLCYVWSADGLIKIVYKNYVTMTPLERAWAIAAGENVRFKWLPYLFLVGNFFILGRNLNWAYFSMHTIGFVYAPEDQRLLLWQNRPRPWYILIL